MGHYGIERTELLCLGLFWSGLGGKSFFDVSTHSYKTLEKKILMILAKKSFFSSVVSKYLTHMEKDDSFFVLF